jgi:hypothetical protein
MQEQSRLANIENIAWQRSRPGSGPSPVYDDPAKDLSIKNGWRRATPPIAANLNETLAEVHAKQVIALQGAE